MAWGGGHSGVGRRSQWHGEEGHSAVEGVGPPYIEPANHR